MFKKDEAQAEMNWPKIDRFYLICKTLQKPAKEE